jgi:peptidoglycan hydrolase-like protein with peptidoglycan-binding domain
MTKFVTVLLVAACLSQVSAASAADDSVRSDGTFLVAQAEKPAAKSVETLDMSAVPDIDRDDVRRVQRALSEKGFSPGPIDGRVGAHTKKAVQSFQDRFGIKASGNLDNQTLFALGIVIGAVEATKQAPPAETKEQAPAAAKKEAPAKQKAAKPKSQTPRPSRASQGSPGQGGSGAGRRSSWCASYKYGGTNCGFSTFEQCRAAISGVGGNCSPN